MLATLSMPASHYIRARGHSERLQDDLTEASSASPPSTAPYTSQELDPFSVSGVSSFNYPATTDPRLLTPVSGVGSPPLHQRTATKAGGYHSSQTAVSGAQGPTPPSTSRMYYSYDLSSSQSPSPITIHPQASEAPSFDMQTFVTTHSPPTNHPSPRDDLPPPPIDPYLPYVVSGVPGSEVDMYGPPGYPHTTADPAYISRPQGSSSEPATAPHMPPLAPTPPILDPPHHSAYRAQLAPSGIRSIAGPGMLPAPHFQPSHPPISSARRPPPRKKRQPKRVVKQSHFPSGAGSTSGLAAGDSPPVKKEFITLAEGCSHDDRRLFALRLKYDHIKGKGMWDKIGDEFDDKSAGKGREALQMRVHRMVAKYGVWPEAEERRVEEAFEWCEENYAKLVLQRLKEIGGCECWEWKPEHIETKLVKKGLMEASLDEKTGIRRRRKNAHPRRRVTPAAPYSQHMHNVMGGHWQTGLGLQPTTFDRPMQQSYDMLNDAGHVSAQESVSDELIDQIFNTSKTQFKSDTDGCVTPEAMDLSYDNLGVGTNGGTAGARTSGSDPQAMTATHSPGKASREEQSTRLARQVVSQYLDDDQYRGGRA
ncbi:hypothetical protein GQ53DRAFT_801828 [Thozetella sp. PMI_491]|nr:hypothetical protein GQ53DRAFT_801828 [Thozetella sp. PMI_491]